MQRLLRVARDLSVPLWIATIALATLATAFAYQEPSGDGIAGASGTDVTAGEAAPDSLGPGADAAYEAPVEVVVRAGDDRLLVVELTGSIVALEEDGDHVTLLDISDLTLVEGERGLLGAAFHPTDDLLYVHYSDLDGTSVIAEYMVDGRTGIADPDSARVVLIVEQPYTNHNGGAMAFGPDGLLYLGFGDGGSAGDPERAALDLGTRLGKILRIDPRETADGDPFAVPENNPFISIEGADPAIWAIGVRNPWRFSFDPATGDLWIADVGQDRWEEVNVAPAGDAGLSFGWSAYEGSERFNVDQPSDGHTGPIASYARDDGRCSISGGAVYRADADAALYGWYVFGDYCSGEVMALDADGLGDGEVVDESDFVSLGIAEALVSIAAGPSGELYAVSATGAVTPIDSLAAGNVDG